MLSTRDAPGTRLPLSYSAVDRDHAGRERPALFDELWREDGTRVLALWGDRALVRRDSSGNASLVFHDVDSMSSAIIRVYLGRVLDDSADLPRGTALVMHTLTEAAALECEPDESAWMTLRQGASSLSERDAGLFVEAIAIANWHSANQFCPRCGAPTILEQGGWVRRCFEDGGELFPRTDPAVIATVTDDRDRLLLGSNAQWESSRFSVLAGFVEPGESFEAALQREVLEEAGVRVDTVRYWGSQPWPFPASIMVGMTSRLAPGYTAEDVRPDGIEIRELRWFSRESLWENRERILLPGPISISRALIEHWYGGPLSRPPEAPGRPR